MSLIFRKNKKGNTIVDTLLVMVVIFALSLVALVGYQFFGDINTDIQANSDLSNTSKQVSSDLYDRYPSAMDGIFVLAFVLLWGMVLVASFMIDSHPIFFIFTLILFIFVLFVGGILGNAYDEFIGMDDISGLETSFPMTNWILSNFLIVIVVIGLSIALVLFGKNKFMGS